MLVLGNLSTNDLLTMGLDALIGDYVYIVANIGVFDPFRSVTDAQVTEYSRRLGGVITDLLGAKALTLLKGTKAGAKIAGVLDKALPNKKVVLDNNLSKGTSSTNKIPMDLQFFANKGATEAAKTAKGVLKEAQLPTKGKIRYVPPQKWTPSQPLPKQNGGVIDKFGNVWTKGPSRTNGQAFEWDVQFSKIGNNQLGWASRDGSHLNVSLDGRITHK